MPREDEDEWGEVAESGEGVSCGASLGDATGAIRMRGKFGDREERLRRLVFKGL